MDGARRHFRNLQDLIDTLFQGHKGTNVSPEEMSRVFNSAGVTPGHFNELIHGDRMDKLAKLRQLYGMNQRGEIGLDQMAQLAHAYGITPGHIESIKGHIASRQPVSPVRRYSN